MTPPAVLADLTTLRLGGPADRIVGTEAADDLVTVVREADAVGEPVLVLGGGSNLVVPDEGFPGVVVRDLRRGITRSEERRVGKECI